MVAALFGSKMYYFHEKFLCFLLIFEIFNEPFLLWYLVTCRSFCENRSQMTLMLIIWKENNCNLRCWVWYENTVTESLQVIWWAVDTLLCITVPSNWNFLSIFVLMFKDFVMIIYGLFRLCSLLLQKSHICLVMCYFWHLITQIVVEVSG